MNINKIYPNMKGLYVDGGLMSSNPSVVGGTYAAILLSKKQKEKRFTSGIILPEWISRETVTNNASEMKAMIAGLSLLPDNWKGIIYTDSKVTRSRVIRRYDVDARWEMRGWMNTPINYFMEFLEHRKRLRNWYQFTWVLLAGHPNRKELPKGESHGMSYSIGRKPRRTPLPVSVWNVWCDLKCNFEKDNYFRGL